MSSAFSFFPFFLVGGRDQRQMLSQAGIYGDLLSAVAKQKIHSREISFFFSFFYSAVMAVSPILHARLPGQKKEQKSNSIHPLITLPRALVEEKVYFASPAVISTRWGRVEKKSQCKPRPRMYTYESFVFGYFFSLMGKAAGKKQNSDRPRALT
jgi:hypothetical protein